jgi:Holliday junction resolvasome RuvABC endonuclease subunit
MHNENKTISVLYENFELNNINSVLKLTTVQSLMMLEKLNLHIAITTWVHIQYKKATTFHMKNSMNPIV